LCQQFFEAKKDRVDGAPIKKKYLAHLEALGEE
jgi:hypothetical protein